MSGHDPCREDRGGCGHEHATARPDRSAEAELGLIGRARGHPPPIHPGEHRRTQAGRCARGIARMASTGTSRDARHAGTTGPAAPSCSTGPARRRASGACTAGRRPYAPAPSARTAPATVTSCGPVGSASDSRSPGTARRRVHDRDDEFKTTLQPAGARGHLGMLCESVDHLAGEGRAVGCDDDQVSARPGPVRVEHGGLVHGVSGDQRRGDAHRADRQPNDHEQRLPVAAPDLTHGQTSDEPPPQCDDDQAQVADQEAGDCEGRDHAGTVAASVPTTVRLAPPPHATPGVRGRDRG